MIYKAWETYFTVDLNRKKMLDEAEYASDTDESDEDYKPGADGEDGCSEVESDGEPENDNDREAMPKQNRKKRTASEPASTATKRTKQSAEVELKTTEKDFLADDDDDENEDALWANFLSNTGQAAATAVDSKSKPIQPNKTSTVPLNASKSQAAKSNVEKPIVNTVVTEVFEFAGEKVEVKKEVKVCNEQSAASNDSRSVESNSSKIASKSTPPFAKARSSGAGGGGGGLSSVLGQIGKKNRLSVLEKTKLDWNGFKRNEGIDEELQTFNKGRDGYLERQDFLQRTDHRRFEIEKNMRHVNRRK